MGGTTEPLVVVDAAADASRRFASLRAEHTRLASLFDQLDLNGNGTLEPHELKSNIERFGEENLANDLMAVLDANNDGVVSFKEFVEGFQAYEAKRLQTLFHVMDGDKSNTVDDDELEAALKQRFHFTGRMLKKLLKELDIDGDGEVSPLEYVEKVSAAKTKGIFECCSSGKPVDVLAIYALLESGEANKDSANESGMTPLMVASSSDNAAAVAVLVEAQAEVEAVDQYIQTALHKAATQDSYRVISVLLNASRASIGGQQLVYVDGRDEQSAFDGEWYRIDGEWTVSDEEASMLNRLDQFGKSALHYAAENNYVNSAMALLVAGADPSTESSKGANAAQVASEKKKADVADLLARWCDATAYPTGQTDIRRAYKALLDKHSK